MGEYRKRRVAVSAVETADAAGSCICELSARLPVEPRLFVLVPDDDLASEFNKTVSTALSEPAKKPECLVKRNKTVRTHKLRPGTSDRGLTPDLVMNFEIWMDHRSAGDLHDHLDARRCIVFVQVSNADEGTHVYRTVDRHCIGSVQLHDLPV